MALIALSAPPAIYLAIQSVHFPIVWDYLGLPLVIAAVIGMFAYSYRRATSPVVGALLAALLVVGMAMVILSPRNEPSASAAWWPATLMWGVLTFLVLQVPRIGTALAVLVSVANLSLRWAEFRSLSGLVDSQLILTAAGRHLAILATCVLSARILRTAAARADAHAAAARSGQDETRRNREAARAENEVASRRTRRLLAGLRAIADADSARSHADVLRSTERALGALAPVPTSESGSTDLATKLRATCAEFDVPFSSRGGRAVVPVAVADAFSDAVRATLSAHRTAPGREVTLTRRGIALRVLVTSGRSTTQTRHSLQVLATLSAADTVIRSMTLIGGTADTPDTTCPDADTEMFWSPTGASVAPTMGGGAADALLVSGTLLTTPLAFFSVWNGVWVSALLTHSLLVWVLAILLAMCLAVFALEAVRGRVHGLLAWVVIVLAWATVYVGGTALPHGLVNADLYWVIPLASLSVWLLGLFRPIGEAAVCSLGLTAIAGWSAHRVSAPDSFLNLGYLSAIITPLLFGALAVGIRHAADAMAFGMESEHQASALGSARIESELEWSRRLDDRLSPARPQVEAFLTGVLADPGQLSSRNVRERAGELELELTKLLRS